MVADEEIEEIVMDQQKTFFDRIARVMEKFAGNRMGQFIIEKSDRFLKVLEDTAKWSLPQDDNNLALERPLPWILFLTLIVWMRVLRVWFSVGCYIVGLQPITSHSMVYSIQTQRRRLRAIRVQGLKTIRSREIEMTVMSGPNKNVTFGSKLRKLFSRAICMPGQLSGQGTVKEDLNQSKTERSFKRTREDEAVDLNLTVDEMLEKYANEDSDNDSDYIPEEEDEDDYSSSSQSSSTSTEEANKEILEEPEDLKKDNKKSDETKKLGGSKNLETTKKEEANKKSEETIGKKPEENKKSEETKKLQEPQDLKKDSKKSLETKKGKDHHKDEIKENGEVKHETKTKTMEEKKSGTSTAKGQDKTEIHTPKQELSTNGTSEDPKISKTPAATAEVAPQIPVSTPKNTNKHLAAHLIEENRRKSTPGHESAASLEAINEEPFKPTSEKVKEEKCTRTITTQTAIELDWTITIKTEITHTKNYPKLEKLKCTTELLTPASSSEDIFYSPVGSPQDFHSIFHPAPLVKGNTTDEVLTSTQKEVDFYESPISCETLEAVDSENQKKHSNQPTYNKQNHNHNNHNAKNRNKNRR